MSSQLVAKPQMPFGKTPAGDALRAHLAELDRLNGLTWKLRGQAQKEIDEHNQRARVWSWEQIQTLGEGNRRFQACATYPTIAAGINHFTIGVGSNDELLTVYAVYAYHGNRFATLLHGQQPPEFVRREVFENWNLRAS